MDRAACVGAAPSQRNDEVYRDPFFPDRGQGYRSALETCFWCPVRLECKELKLAIKPEYGVWAGGIIRRGSANKQGTKKAS